MLAAACAAVLFSISPTAMLLSPVNLDLPSLACSRHRWMNPVDYETAEAAAEEGKRRREGDEEEPGRKVGQAGCWEGALRRRDMPGEHMKGGIASLSHGHGAR